MMSFVSCIKYIVHAYSFCQLSESSVDFNDILLLMLKHKRARLSQMAILKFFHVDYCLTKNHDCYDYCQYIYLCYKPQ